MNETAINWDLIPEIITKDQLYKICHISKSTALYLLKSGKIPCEYNEHNEKSDMYIIRRKKWHRCRLFAVILDTSIKFTN